MAIPEGYDAGKVGEVCVTVVVKVALGVNVGFGVVVEVFDGSIAYVGLKVGVKVT